MYSIQYYSILGTTCEVLILIMAMIEQTLGTSQAGHTLYTLHYTVLVLVLVLKIGTDLSQDIRGVSARPRSIL